MRSLVFLFVLTFAGGIYTTHFDSLLYLEKDLDGILRPRDLNSNSAYCYKFTWLGQDFDNETFTPYLNKTCADKFASAKPMPLCLDPMVASYNGTPPDLDWLMDNKPKLAFCRLSQGSVCAKFSYIFDGVVQNVTRYCTKVTVDNVKMTSGCIQDSRGRYTTEICACESKAGGVPCNSAGTTSLNTLTIIFHCLATFLLVKFLL